jgi:tetratricopeptide (TPR) repeat protein
LVEPDLHAQTFGLAGLPAVFSRVWLALSLVEQGHEDEATTIADEALAIAREHAHTFSQIVGYAGAGIVRAVRGDHATAITALEPGLVMARMADLLLLVPLVGAPLGWCYARTGRHAEGIALLQDAVGAADAMNFGANHALRLTWLADAQLAAGNAEGAKKTALRALETGRRHGERGHEAYALRLLGTLAEHGRPADLEAAREHYRTALEIAQSLGMRPLAAAVASCLP